MRIAVILPGGLHPSGREEMVPVWANLLAELARGHDVHAFTIRHLPRPATYALRGVTVHDLGRPSAPAGLTLWVQWRALSRALASRGPFDVVHGIWADPCGLLAACAGRRFGIPALVTCDSGEFVSLPDIAYGSARSWRGRARVALACRVATGVHVTSAFMAQSAGLAGVAAEVIPIGVRLPRSAPTDRPEGPPWRLLQVASLSRVKNQAILLPLVARLSRRLDVQVDLVGSDTLDGALQAQARAEGVADRVRFHGYVPNEALGPFHARAHLYVQTSRHEAAGAAVLEAAAAGLPVLGTRVGYLADWAPDRAVAVEGTGLDAWEAAVAGLLGDSARRARLAAAARAWAERHDVAWSAAAVAGLYQGLRVTGRSSQHTQR
ncbi:MAG: glycosyltransferase [Acidobacteriota bacterium]